MCVGETARCNTLKSIHHDYTINIHQDNIPEKKFIPPPIRPVC